MKLFIFIILSFITSLSFAETRTLTRGQDGSFQNNPDLHRMEISTSCYIAGISSATEFQGNGRNLTGMSSNSYVSGLLTNTSAQATYINQSVQPTLLSNTSAQANLAELAGNNTFAGFTALGTGNTQIKVKYLTGTTNASENAYVDVAHGLDQTKIIGATVLVFYTANQAVPMMYPVNGYQFFWSVQSGNFYVANSETQSELILSKPIRIVVVYIE